MSKVSIRNNALILAEQADKYNEADGNLAQSADALLIDLHEEWIDDGLLTWGLDNIPKRAVNAVTQLLAYELGRRNRKLSESKLINLREGAVLGERALRRQVAKPYNGEPVKGVYF